MRSRAHMLLEKEYLKLQKEPIWGISAKPLNDDDFFVWEAKVHGLKDTLWEGGIFKLYLKFSESYNCSPPQVFFTTIPFHPNVHISSGRPCLDFLDNLHEWKEFYNIRYILLSVQTLLSNPVLENAINQEAASFYRDKIDIYRETVMNCVLLSKRLDGKKVSYALINKTAPNVKSSLPLSKRRHIDCTCSFLNKKDLSFFVQAGFPQTSGEGNTISRAKYTAEDSQKPRNISLHSNKVSFEDYLRLWKGIATSKPSVSPFNPLREFLRKDEKLQNAHFELSRKEVEEEIRLQLAEHKKVMYGKMDMKNDTDGSASISGRVDIMKHIYGKKPNTEEISSIESPAIQDDILDEEAIDLVNWTKTLSPEKMTSLLED